MVGEKPRSEYKRSRKGKSFSGNTRWSNRPNETSLNESETEPENEPSTSSCSHEVEQPSSNSGASRHKLVDRGFESDISSYSDQHDEENDSIGSGYRLVDLGILSSTLSEVHECEGNLQLYENSESRAGLMSNLSVECTSCNKTTNMQTSSSVTVQGRSFDVNKRVVYHTLETGGGYESLASFCSIMNMPCMSKQAYYKQMETILEAQEIEAQVELVKAGQKLRDLLKEEDSALDELIDVTVSFDGTWAKRGFTSLFGVFFVMSVDTGEVLDYHVLSKSCQKCALKKSKLKDNPEEFEEWKMNHVNNEECDINFTGSSPAMEAEAAAVLWNRSIEKHNVRYKFMVCDGDSKSFNAVEHVYNNCVVEKLDCVGHVQKRMGKRLLKLKGSVKGKLKDGKTIGGKGRLTEGKIKQLQRYYGLAIRQNILTKLNPTDAEVNVAVYAMKKSIIATLKHNVTSDNPSDQHMYCPPGENSWCKWQQDKATGTNTYKPDNLLPNVFQEILRPVFMTLSDTKLLKRCVRGATQNRNEWRHS